MFFLIRSAVCISLVAAALPPRQAADRPILDGLVPGAETAAGAALIQFCGAHPDRCVLPLQVASAAPLAVDIGAPRRLGTVRAAPSRRSDRE